MRISPGRFDRRKTCASCRLRISAANQDGSVLLVALLALLAVTIYGVVSLNTSSVELLAGRNEHDIREVFYLAEAGVMEGVQVLVDTKKIDLDEKYLFWHHDAKKNRDPNCKFQKSRGLDYK